MKRHLAAVVPDSDDSEDEEDLSHRPTCFDIGVPADELDALTRQAGTSSDQFNYCTVCTCMRRMPNTALSRGSQVFEIFMGRALNECLNECRAAFTITQGAQQSPGALTALPSRKASMHLMQLPLQCACPN